jgi:hypothetical protein
VPERIQLKRSRGWRLPENAVSVARPGRWGNPFRIGSELSFPFSELDEPCGGSVVRDRAHAVEIFAIYARITTGYGFLAHRELAGKDLACWCPLDGAPCHADVLLKLAAEEWES